jgi:hypothetical protein
VTVRREIMEPRLWTDAWSREDPMRARAVLWGYEGRVRWPEARRRNGPAITVEALMNNAG